MARSKHQQRAAVWTSLVLLLLALGSIGRGAEPAMTTGGAVVPTPATPLQGLVRAADGSPAGGAVVWAAKFSYGPLQRRETVADSAGHYTLDLDPGDWNLWARRGTQGAGGPPHHLKVTRLAGRDPEPLTIDLEERGTFRGRLLEAETGNPIPRGQLFLDAGLVLTTDADGRFEVGGLSRSNHESFVVAPGRMRLRVLFDTTGRADTELDVPVPRAGKLVGRVTDQGGKPIPGAYVGRHTSGTYFSINGLFLACDAEGRFAYDDAVPPGQSTWLAAAAPGYLEEQHEGLHVPEDGKPLELHFRLRPKPSQQPAPRGHADEALRTVSGIVCGPDKKPVAGVLVRWGYQPFVGATEVRTDRAGYFRFDVPDKAGMLAVLPRDSRPEFPRVAAGGNQTVEVTLREGHTARGLVRDDTGKPIKNVKVIPVVASPDPRIGNPYWLSETAVATDAAGRFALTGIPDGARFDFLKPGLSEVRNQELVLDGPDNAVTVTMWSGGAISGRVVDRHGKPVRSFRVLVGFPRDRRPGDQSSGFFAGYSGMGVRFTSADGGFVLTGVGAGSVYRITVLADRYGAAVADRVVAVPANRLASAEPVTLRAGPPLRLRVRAVTSDGKPIAGARVTLILSEPELDRSSFVWGYHDASWKAMERTRTAPDGWADFPVLSFTEATVLVQAPGYAHQRLGWRDGRKELTVTLAPEAVLTGEVRAAAGAGETFYVNLMSSGDATRPGQAGGDQISAHIGRDARGRFRIAELPAGTWTVTVCDADGRETLHQSQVTLTEGETREMEVERKKE
jgi:hypothetical protein